MIIAASKKNSLRKKGYEGKCLSVVSMHGTIENSKPDVTRHHSSQGHYRSAVDGREGIHFARRSKAILVQKRKGMLFLGLMVWGYVIKGVFENLFRNSFSMIV